MFTTKCYIKKYSFDLHDKLVEFGYTPTFAAFGDIIAVNNGKITILPNNDHTINQLNAAGYIDCDNNDILFSGDFIFKRSIGRTDLGGNEEEMFESINKIKKYNKDIIIKPGHGDDTVLGNEINLNPFFK